MEINLGSIDQIPVGQGHCFMVEKIAVAVFKNREGQLFAMQNRCPHLGGPLADGIFAGTQVVCPLHGHKFDCTTGKGSEGRECIKTFKVRVENNFIMVSLPALAKFAAK